MAVTVVVAVAWSKILIVAVAPEVEPDIVTSVPKFPEAFETFKIFVDVFKDSTVAVIVVEPSEPNAETVSLTVKGPDLSTNNKYFGNFKVGGVGEFS
jgi:hypothetical protein